MKRKRIKKDGLFVPFKAENQNRFRLPKPSLKTKSGIMVRSSYEQICADCLFDNNIRFVFEPLMLIEGNQFRPDFYLSDHNIFIEICGMHHMPYYKNRIEQKKKLYAKSKLESVFIDYDGKGALKDIIKEKLIELNILLNN